MSQTKKSYKKGIVKKILKDHFHGYWEMNKDTYPEVYRESIEDNVRKAIRCGTQDLGYARYECLGCREGEPEPVLICFTCKSRFCHGCGKKYTDDWAAKQQERILNVPHRHTVFTIPKELRKYFWEDPNRLKQLGQEVDKVIQHYYRRKNKSKEYVVGVITVIHTFGRDLKYNPHIHALVTEGAMDKAKNWKYVDYIPYSYLRKAWQKLLLDLLKSWFPEDEKVKRIIDQLYQRYPYGFYVHAEQRMKNAKSAAKYIGRYLARPAIAEYRIVNYDGIHVHFWYEDHQTKKRVDVTLNAYRFIRLLIQHIPPKHFQLVGRFGLYSRRKNREAQKIVDVWNFMRTQQIEMVFERKQQKKSYRQRMIESFDRDPIQCPCCGHTMELVVIWHAKYGVLYHYAEDLWRKLDKKWGISAYERKRNREKKTA